MTTSVSVPLPGHPGIAIQAETYDDIISTGEQLARLARKAKAEAHHKATARMAAATEYGGNKQDRPRDPLRTWGTTDLPMDVSRVVPTAVVPRIVRGEA